MTGEKAESDLQIDEVFHVEHYVLLLLYVYNLDAHEKQGSGKNMKSGRKVSP
jgi:hypothetical protein